MGSSIKKFAVYSPYLDTASGGEKYILTIAEILSSLGKVDMLLDSHLWSIGAEKIKKLNETRHNLNLEKVNFINAPVGKGSSIFQRNKFLKQYDLLFYLSDGSIFYSTAKKSFVHIQMPLDNIQNKGVISKLKWSSWKKVIYNSRFTQDHIEKKIKKTGIVIYPPVDLRRFSNKKETRKNIILNAGRFVGDGVKKQDVLIKAFKLLVEKNSLNDWELHLAGALRDSDKKYFDELVSISLGSKIIFHPNISYEQLTELYLKSKIYWHGMGYEESDPKKMEHFGMTTVEAMSAGCVPVVVDKGGQVEIVKDGVSGFLWNNIDELVEKTGMLIRDSTFLKELSEKAKNSIDAFSEDEFKEKILKLINE